MKILYVMPLVVGLEDILKGDEESKGLPSMILPMEKLLEQGHQIDVILISNYQGEYNIKNPKLQKMRILVNINNDLVNTNKLIKIIRKFKSAVQEVFEVHRAIKREKYDVVFCHGTASILANIVANANGIPCVYRLYGTVELYSDLCRYKGLLGVFRHLVYYLIFKLPKYCIIATDEGSHTDKVYNLWKPHKKAYHFFHLLNGVDVQNICNLRSELYNIPDKPYLFMAGRVTDVKNQSFAIRLVHELEKDGIDIDLFFAGHIDNQYYLKLQKLISNFKLNDKVHFMGAVSREYLKLMGYYSRACVIWDDFCQNSNVFYELYSTGCIIVSVDDGSLDRFVENQKSAFLAKEVCEAADYVKLIMELDDAEREAIRERAIEKASRILMTWDERVEKEINILKEACGE